MDTDLTIEYGDRPTLRARAVRRLARATVRPTLDVAAALGLRAGPDVMARLPIQAVNRVADRLAGAVLRPPRGTRVTPVHVGAVRGEWIEPPLHAPERAVLYFHGGGLMFCGPGTHRRMIGRVAAAARANALHVDYRMAPRHTLSDALTDAVDGYRNLLSRGYSPDRIVLAGDSGGGLLALAAVRALLDEGLPCPAAVLAMAPQVDVHGEVRAGHPNTRRDAIIPAAGMTAIGAIIAHNNPADVARAPLAVPVQDYPPVLIQASSAEVLLADAHAMADRLRAANVPCTLQVWEGQVHVFQAVADLLPEARSALARIGEFIDSALADTGRAHQTSA
ncbi:alpha/beta hydrolase [Nocardia uniformis]|uniref:Alpha/beta hydrolase n=1 Tax=Nocardia uniformis TaxID=53432 RepID=A0A849C8R5_9NOCA|nr:alpha/beta hydrolase [Nocardia uniformis]NNH72760.1 alpha/beta hydrolase [Nocardia uniformis]